jgi:hypothetical protein
MKMKTLYAALSGAFLLGAATLAPAQTSNAPAGNTAAHPVKNTEAAMSSDYRAQKKQIDDAYKQDKAACKGQSGNAKDVCQKEAKAKEKIAKADLEAQRKGTPHAQYEAAKTKAEQNYEVAKEKCEDQKGKEKAACKKQAKADEDKALADAKNERGSMASNTSPAPSRAPAPASTSPNSNMPSKTSSGK